ncbi:MAG TPA: HyaD/HybD family hydrogenase maturation endopeptidase [bacterium]
MKTLVLGIGNVLLTDEGVGIHALDELRRRFDFDEEVELLDGGTAGVELLRYLDGREHVIVIDAIAAGHPPGTVFRVEGDDVPRTFHQRISPHQIGLSDVLATALITDSLPAAITMFGVEPKELTTGLALTPEIDASLDKLVCAVVDELRSLGHTVKERENPAPRRREWSPT